MAFPLIAAATGAVTSKEFLLEPKDLPAGIFTTGLAGTETFTLQFSPDTGSNFEDAYNGGTKITFTATHNADGIQVPGRYKLVKSTTAAPSSAILSLKGQL